MTNVSDQAPVEPPTAQLPSAGAVSPGSAIALQMVADGHLTDAQVAYARRVRSKTNTGRTLLSVLAELGFATDQNIRSSLRQLGHNIRLGEVLVELGHLSEAELNGALALQAGRPGSYLTEILSEQHLIDEHKVFDVLADLLGFVHAAPDSLEIDRKLYAKARQELCTTHSFVPCRSEDGRPVVVFADPLNGTDVAAAKRHFGRDFAIGIASHRSVLAAIARADREPGRTTVQAGEGEHAIVAAVNGLVEDALREGASDIHLEPTRDRLRVRFRLDGAMVHHRDYPAEIAASMVSRIKIMAGTDIAEKRRHQDGRILFNGQAGELDIRVSVYVTIHGETVVMRLLNNRHMLIDIADLGMAPRMLQLFRDEALDAPSGVVLVTGPTGSGKTTTLYSAVNYLNDSKTSIITAEDPVEFTIDGISQCMINPKIDVSYEETLKHIVRQDPDVIVIGEIRDQFSAEVAVQAALTGHKVLTTFHTEDSIGGLLRLLNMNIEAFLISSTVISVVAQRLVRRVCPACAEDHVLSSHEQRRLGYSGREGEGLTFKRARGCIKCRHRGYKGRTATFELLVLNERVKEAVIARKTSYEIRRIGMETSGLVTLLEDGIAKGAAGLTSFEEITRMLPRLAKPRPLAEVRRLLGAK